MKSEITTKENKNNLSDLSLAGLCGTGRIP
jgi:hypothetical protein